MISFIFLFLIQLFFMFHDFYPTQPIIQIHNKIHLYQLKFNNYNIFDTAISIIAALQQMSQSPSQQQSQHSLHAKYQQLKNTPNKLIKKSSINLKLQNNPEFNQSSSSSQDSHQQRQLSSLANLPSQQHQKRKQHSQHQKKSEISNFIIKTYRILEDRTNSDIIHWTDQGNAFIVKNKDKFQNEILPKYFKHKKFSSFVRQLNMYDFHKIRKEKEIPIFKHKYFREGCIDLLAKIKRKSGDEVIGQGEDQQMAGGQGIGTVSFLNDTRNYIPSLFELPQKPMASAMSFKSKSMLPYPNMLASQPSLGNIPWSGGVHASQIDRLLQQNSELSGVVSQLSREQVSLQIQADKRKEKIVKILSVLMSCDLGGDNEVKNDGVSFNEAQFPSYTLRDLQHHFSSQEEPYGFGDYQQCLKKIYDGVKSNVMKMNGLIQSKEENKIQQQ